MINYTLAQQRSKMRNTTIKSNTTSSNKQSECRGCCAVVLLRRSLSQHMWFSFQSDKKRTSINMSFRKNTHHQRCSSRRVHTTTILHVPDGNSMRYKVPMNGVLTVNSTNPIVCIDLDLTTGQVARHNHGLPLTDAESQMRTVRMAIWLSKSIEIDCGLQMYPCFPGCGCDGATPGDDGIPVAHSIQDMAILMMERMMMTYPKRLLHLADVTSDDLTRHKKRILRHAQTAVRRLGPIASTAGPRLRAVEARPITDFPAPVQPCIIDAYCRMQLSHIRRTLKEVGASKFTKLLKSK